MALCYWLKTSSWRLYFLALMALSLLYIIVIVILQSHMTKTKEYLRHHSNPSMNTEEFVNLVNSTYGSFRIHERIELEDGSQILVGDILLNASDSNYENVKAMRIIGALEVEGGVHAVFRLKLPEEFSKNTIDSSKWEIDDRYIEPYSYFHICAETVFYSDAVKLSRNTQASVLSLGLGGGVVNSFLHHHFPKLNITVIEISSRMAYIALKWFGLKLDNYHSLVIADGVSFIEEEVKKGVTYDVLFLDACYSDSKYKILCPTDAFLGMKVIENMSRLMSYDGILIVNAAPGSMSMSEERKLLTEMFSKFFLYCSTRNASGINEVFYCTNRAPDIEKHVNLFEFLGFSTSAPFT